MMTGRRRRYQAAFEATVALEALRGELPIARLGAKHGGEVHQTLIHARKRRAVGGMAGRWPRARRRPPRPGAVRGAAVERPRARIGALVVERDLLRRASGR